jgi:hypothetical protein
MLAEAKGVKSQSRGGFDKVYNAHHYRDLEAKIKTSASKKKQGL